MKYAFSLLALALVFPAIGKAQSGTLAAGTRIRVTSPSDDLKRHVTTVTEVRGDSIVVAGRAGSRTIAHADITALDVSTGTRSRIMGGAALGLGAGALLGGIVGAAQYEGPDLIFDSRMELAAASGFVSGAVGLVAGGVVGALRRTDRWQSTRLPVRAAIIPSRSGGVSMNISRTF